MNGKYFLIGGITLFVLAGLFFVAVKTGVAETKISSAQYSAPTTMQQEPVGQKTCTMGSSGCGCKETGSCSCSSCGCSSGSCSEGCACGCAK